MQTPPGEDGLRHRRHANDATDPGDADGINGAEDAPSQSAAEPESNVNDVENSILKVYAWRNPGKAFMIVALTWTWAFLYFYASDRKRFRSAAKAAETNSAHVDPTGDTLLAMAAVGPLLAGASLLMSLEGDHGIRRVFYTQLLAPHSPLLWLSSLPVTALHASLWAGWNVISHSYNMDTVNAKLAPLVEAASALTDPSRAGSALARPVYVLSSKLALGLADLISAAKLPNRWLIPHGSGDVLRRFAPSALLVRGPSALLASLGPAVVSELGWRAVLLPHVLREGAQPLKASLLIGCLSVVWQLGPSYVSIALSRRAGPLGWLLALLDALTQLPLAVLSTALYMASRGSLPLTVGFRAAVLAAGVVFAGPLSPQAPRTGSSSSASLDHDGYGDEEEGDISNEAAAAVAGDYGGSGDSGSYLDRGLASLLYPSRGSDGRRYAYDASGWNRVDAAAALLIALYVLALPALAYLWWLGVQRQRRQKAAVRRQREAAQDDSQPAAERGPPAEGTGRSDKED